jgi:hypothetical protein
VPGFESQEKVEMNTQANKPLHLPLLVGGIAAILVSSIAIGSLAISTPDFNGVSALAESPEEATAPAIAAPGAGVYRCAECGVIASMRKIEAPDEETGVNARGRMAAGKRGEIEDKPVRNYEITIRLQDGSMRVINDVNPATWRLGERVTLIGGTQ